MGVINLKEELMKMLLRKKIIVSVMAILLAIMLVPSMALAYGDTTDVTNEFSYQTCGCGCVQAVSGFVAENNVAISPIPYPYDDCDTGYIDIAPFCHGLNWYLCGPGCPCFWW